MKSEYGKRVPLAFLLVGLLAGLSRWHHSQWELFSDTMVAQGSTDQLANQVKSWFVHEALLFAVKDNHLHVLHLLYL